MVRHLRTHCPPGRPTPKLLKSKDFNPPSLGNPRTRSPGALDGPTDPLLRTRVTGRTRLQPSTSFTGVSS